MPRWGLEVSVNHQGRSSRCHERSDRRVLLLCALSNR